LWDRSLLNNIDFDKSINQKMGDLSCKLIEKSPKSAKPA
jgi:hypothetical protein